LQRLWSYSRLARERNSEASIGRAESYPFAVAIAPGKAEQSGQQGQVERFAKHEIHFFSLWVILASESSWSIGSARGKTLKRLNARVGLRGNWKAWQVMTNESFHETQPAALRHYLRQTVPQPAQERAFHLANPANSP
jgi:hypothetical protein